MDLAIGCQRIVEPDIIAHPPAIDEYDDMFAEMVLIVEHVATQVRCARERHFKRVAQACRVGDHFRRFGEAAQLLCKDYAGHGCNRLSKFRLAPVAGHRHDPYVSSIHDERDRAESTRLINDFCAAPMPCYCG